MFVDSWNSLSEDERLVTVKVNNFFCGLHLLVNFAECLSPILGLFDKLQEHEPAFPETSNDDDPGDWRQRTTKRRAFISSLGSYWRYRIYQQTTSDPHSTTWLDKQHPCKYSCWSTILPTPGSTTQHGMSSSGLCSVRPSGPTMMLKVIFIFYLFILRCLEYSVNNIYIYILTSLVYHKEFQDSYVDVK